MFDVYQSSFTETPSLDDVIGAAMRWHFDESTGQEGQTDRTAGNKDGADQ